MAVNNIKIFDQNKANMLSDEAYNSNTQRINGVQQGIASSQLQNKTLYQVSLVAYAIGQMMQANGLDANDADAVSTFANNMSQTIMQKVLDKANSDEAIAGTNNTKFITPLTLKAVVGSYTGRNLKANAFESYTTVLAAANAINAGGTFFAINGTKLREASDRPFSVDAEFQYVVFVDGETNHDGNYLRKVVLAFNYTNSSANFWYVRNIWQNQWQGNWRINAESANTLGIFANADSSQRRFIMSPQTPIAYCPIINYYNNTGYNNIETLLYNLPNSQGAICFTNISNVDYKVIILNYASAIQYTTSLGDISEAYFLAYDNDSFVVETRSGDSYSCSFYRYSASSAPVLASTQILGSSDTANSVKKCRQSAFSTNGIAAAICYKRGVCTFLVGNKSSNQLALVDGPSVYDDYRIGYGYMVRVNETLSAIIVWETVNYTSQIIVFRQDGTVYSNFTPRASSNVYSVIYGCVAERILLSNEYDRHPVYGVVDVDGGHAENSVIKNVVYNLPDKSCLWQNAHYSNWTGPDGYPGVSTAVTNGKQIAENDAGGFVDAFLVNSIGCFLYESYGGVILETFSAHGGNWSLACKASAIPYSMFFL